MPTVNVLSIQRLQSAEADQIRAVDPSVNLVDAGGWFDGEIRDSWPLATSQRYLAPDAMGQGTRAERDALLRDAEIILGGWPYPLDLRARSPRLRWFHQRPAGASNLLRGDIWGSDVTVTTARGLGNTLPIAEYVIATALHFAKGLSNAERERARGRFDHASYRPRLLAGRTMGVIGVGGIGEEVGRLAAAMGMRVVGTRRTPGPTLPAGFERVAGPEGLMALLAESDYVAVCAQFTPETEGMLNAAAFAAMPPDAVVINIARGEVIDEAALLGALDAGQLRGAALDVYVGEFDHAPPPALWNHPRVLITPHTSAMSDVSYHRAIDVFCENLTAFLAEQPLRNVIDWARGY